MNFSGRRFCADSSYGLKIIAVIPDSRLKAGLQCGDRIMEVNNTRIDSEIDFGIYCVCIIIV